MIGINLLSNALSESDREGRFYGVTIAEVTNNQDEEGFGRIKVKFPWLSDTDESFWARVLTPMAGKGYGIYFLPEVGDEVLVAFEHGMIEFPYILGALWNGKDKPPDTNSDGKNNKRLIKSRSGNIIRLDDTEGDEKIEIIDKSTKNSIVISTKDNTITIVADADITIQSSQGKLKLKGNGIEIDSQAEIKITASQNMDLKGGPQLNIKGNIVNIN
ncbi:phage baseplate assembly protein V [Limnofasciculus baicalensis]|uniref:Phage baseplate assembly protein V n=1 Tax=Limnofasciculus baicalensis BBK-W-15 TaxID=2699891 RepID=A0AAE3GT07_9CYAN|nr:phage baseplate assembly protein V [Limnofasciculus baicalensis]MCP2729243.1 phage baseplate assembly protein V [Limnofasciculus baicalensis BBK-W-15]